MSPTGNRINDRSSHDVDAVRCREIASLLRGARRVVSNYAETDPTWDGAVHSQLAAERLLSSWGRWRASRDCTRSGDLDSPVVRFLMLQHLDALSMLFEAIRRLRTQSASSLVRSSRLEHAHGGLRILT